MNTPFVSPSSSASLVAIAALLAMPAAAFATPQFRESRDPHGRLDYLDFGQRQALIRGLPVVDVTSGKGEPF